MSYQGDLLKVKRKIKVKSTMHMTHFNELSELYTKVTETVGKKIFFSKLDLCEGGSI